MGVLPHRLDQLLDSLHDQMPGCMFDNKHAPFAISQASLFTI